MISSVPATAERELHVVSIHEGWLNGVDFQSRPKASVLVDRPDAEVVLVLLDPGYVDWHVEVADGSFVETVILGGNNATNSRVFLRGIEFIAPKEPNLPYVQFSEGTRFRHLLNRLSDLTSIARMSSFQSSYKAEETAILVDQVQSALQAVGTDYLQEQLWDLKDTPPELQRLVKQSDQRQRKQVLFDKTGMTVIRGSGQRFYPVPPEIDAPFLPAGAYFDAPSQSLFGISYGGDGFIYRVDVKTGQWSVVANLEGFNGAELMYHPDSNSFALTGAQNKPNHIAVLSADGLIDSRRFEMGQFVGFKDIYDYPNSSPPRLIPTAFDGTWLVVEANGKVSDMRKGYGVYRRYGVNLDTNQVMLLEYRDHLGE